MARDELAEWGRSSWQPRVASIHFRRKDMVLPTLQSFHDRCYWIVELLFDEELPNFLTTNMPDDDRFFSSLRLPASSSRREINHYNRNGL